MQEVNSHSSQVIFLGEARFPYGFAAIQRMTLMGRALLHEGFEVTVISRKGSWYNNEKINFYLNKAVDSKYSSVLVLQ